MSGKTAYVTGKDNLYLSATFSANALVGGASGIGQAVAEMLASRGYLISAIDSVSMAKHS